MHATQEQEQRS